MAQAGLETVILWQGLANGQNSGGASTASGQEIPYELTPCLMVGHKSPFLPGRVIQDFHYGLLSNLIVFHLESPF
jgi:hypothetical protein